MNRMWIIFIAWMGVSISYAAEIEDFSGAVTNARVTINPATVGLIGANHIQYGFYGYNNNDSTIKPLSFEYLSINPNNVSGGEIPIQVLNPLEQAIHSVEFEVGTIAGAEVLIATGFDLFSLGVGIKTLGEIYQNGRYLDSQDFPLGNTYTEVSKADYLNTATSLYLGIPSDLFTFGVKFSSIAVNNHILDAKFYKVLIQDGTGTLLDINGTVSLNYLSKHYETTDYGLLIPDFIPGFLDVGLVYRPATEAKMQIEPVSENFTSLSGGEFAFTDPEFRSVGLGTIFELGSFFGFQLLGDIGQFGTVDNSINGDTLEAGSLSGQLGRIVFGPLFDISYGTQTQDFVTILFKKTTTSLQFPFPFLEGNVLKIGSQRYQVFSNDESIVDVTYYRVSANIKFGEGSSSGSSRCGSVKPKTKELSFMDRLSC